MFPILFNRPKIVTASAFSPADIVGLVAWYDFSDISTLYQDSGKATPVTADADPIGAVENKANPGTHDATQGTTANKPAYKTGIIGGLSVGLGDGGDWMQANTLFDLFDGVDTPFSVCGVFEKTNNAAEHVIWSTSKDASNSALIDLFTDNSPAQYTWNRRDDTPALKAVGGGTPDLDPHYFVSTFSGTASNLWVDGVQIVTAGDQDVGNLTLDRFTLWGIEINTVLGIMPGSIGELLVYSAELDTGGVTDTNAYLAAKWSL